MEVLDVVQHPAHAAPHPNRNRAPRGGGWLGTGDADLKTKIRRAKFLQHYSAVLPFLGDRRNPAHPQS